MRIPTLLTIAGLIVLISAISVKAAVFEVPGVWELQAALTEAMNNNENDVVNIASGNYANTPYTYSSVKDHSLTILGAGASSTSLDGGSATQILTIATTQSNAHINISGITFQNGYSSGDTGGLDVSTVAANITVEDCSFINNFTSDNNGGARLESESGEVTVRSCAFTNNSAGTLISTRVGLINGLLPRTGSNGGALIKSNTGSVILTGNTFTGNAAVLDSGGAGVVTDYGVINLTDNTFSDNSAGGSGGGAGIRYDGYAPPTRYSGKDLLLNSIAVGDVTLTGNTFNNNTSGHSGGGLGISAGGSYLLGLVTGGRQELQIVTVMPVVGNIILNGNAFNNNSVCSSSTGLSRTAVTIDSVPLAGSGGGGAGITSLGAVYLTGNTFTGNSYTYNQIIRDLSVRNSMRFDGAENYFGLNSVSFNSTGDLIRFYGSGGGGAGISSLSGPVVLTSNKFTGNCYDYNIDRGVTVILTRLIDGTSISGFGGGGAGLSSQGPVKLVNNVFGDNSATYSDYHTLIYIYPWFATGGGAGIFSEDNVTLTNNTFSGNYADPDGGGLLMALAGGSGSTADIYNNIIWGNNAVSDGDDLYVLADPVGASDPAAVKLYNNDYHELYIDDNTNLDEVGNDNIDEVPILDSTFHLNTGSPCIDTGRNDPPGGLPLSDFEGDDRILDGDGNGVAIVDMGADELVPGSITIIKDAVPEDPWIFQFTGDLGSFSLDDDGVGSNSFTSQGLQPGSYTVSEIVPPGWSLTDIVCNDPDGETIVNTAAAGAIIDLDSGEDIICTFTNTRPVSNIYTLTVEVEPGGGGSVRGNGIDCPVDCTEAYGEGTVVRLTAVPAPGYVFDHWTGCQSPGSSCDITMNSDVRVTAHFRESYRLEVIIIPSIGGSVRGDGIDCPQDCVQYYSDPTSVSLASQANEGFIFIGFDGCSSVVDDQCSVDIGQEGAGSDSIVRAVFAPDNGRSIIYRESINIFSWAWMLYIPVLQEQLDGNDEERYWLLLEYVRPDGYFRVIDYGRLVGSVPAFESAQLVIEDSTWMIYIPVCDVPWDPDNPYWFILQVDFTDPNDVRVYIIDFGLAE